MINARFWTYHNGSPVKLTLRPGQELNHYQSEPTEEGWSSEAESWFYDGATVTQETASDGCDCDGRLSRFTESICPLDRLAASIRSSGPRMPDWESLNRSQRDYAAEAAGY